jgi:hypothetical protein
MDTLLAGAVREFEILVRGPDETIRRLADKLPAVVLLSPGSILVSGSGSAESVREAVTGAATALRGHRVRCMAVIRHVWPDGKVETTCGSIFSEGAALDSWDGRVSAAEAEALARATDNPTGETGNRLAAMVAARNSAPVPPEDAWTLCAIVRILSSRRFINGAWEPDLWTSIDGGPAGRMIRALRKSGFAEGDSRRHVDRLEARLAGRILDAALPDRAPAGFNSL